MFRGDIVFQVDPPSLRVMLADILFRAIDCLTAIAIVLLVMAIIAIPMIVISVGVGTLIKQFISVCSL